MPLKENAKLVLFQRVDCFDTWEVDPYYTRPMSPGRSQQTEELVDAMLLASRGSTISRQFAFAELPRLKELAGNGEEQPTLVARFHTSGPRAGIVGRVTAKLRSTCQRCLRPVDLAIDDEFHIVIAATDVELDELAETQDAVVADASRFDLAWLAEEQLLLAVPLVPLHPSEGCSEEALHTETRTGVRAEPVARKAETQHPFANLRELMNREMTDKDRQD
jgi:uncharacterized protein